MSGQRKPQPPGFSFKPQEEQVTVTPPRNLDKQATITVDDKIFTAHANDPVKICDLSRGAYGIIEKMHHKPSNIIMDVKRIKAFNAQSLQLKRLLMDLDVSLRASACPYTVHFCGAIFQEGDVWFSLEARDMSFKFYTKVYKNNKTITENILGKIAFSVVSALHYLYSKLSLGPWKRSGKLSIVCSLLQIWIKQGLRTLIFLKFPATLCLLEQHLQNHNFKYLKMDSKDSVSKRQNLIKTFNENPEYLVFLATTRVGGLEVNLTGADRVINYDPDLNPATDNQAKKRAWRIGQQRNVTA